MKILNWQAKSTFAPWVYVSAGALVLWNAMAVLSSAAISYLGIAAAWIVAWAACNWLLHRPIRKLQFPGWLRYAVVASLLLLVIADIDRYGNKFANRQGLYLAMERFSDKVRLETLPSIAPSVVVGTQPQTFYAYAPDATSLSMQFEGGPALPGRGLGHGVFRLHYDPREHGPPSASVVLTSDEGTFSRQLKVIDQLAHPRWLTGYPNRGLALAVSEETDQLVSLERSGEYKLYSTGDGPTDAAMIDDDVVLVTHRYDPDLWMVRLSSGAVERKLDLGFGQLAMAVSPAGDLIAVSLYDTRPRIVFVDPVDWQISAVAKIDNPADWLSFDSTGDRLVYSDRKGRSLRRLDLVDGRAIESVAEIKLGRPAVAMTKSARDNEVFVAVTGYDPTGIGPVGNHFVEDQLLRIDVVDWVVRSQHMTARSSDKQRHPAEVRYGGSPMGLRYDERGDVLVAFAGTDDVWRYTDRSPPVRLLERDTIEGLWAPHSAVDMGGGVIAVSAPSQGAIGMFDARGELVGKAQIAPPDEALSPPALAARRGERGFYESARRGLSCQSCHIFGETDHALHNIAGAEFSGETRRMPALTLRGVADTAPFLRDASYHSVGSVIAVAERRYDGYIRNGGDRRGDLDRYAETLVLRPHPDSLTGRDLDRERAGLDVFVEASCDKCHTPPAFTNLSQHLPSSLFPEYGKHSEADEFLDTPSLFAMRDKYPYLQDGRATTLESVFADHNAANLHGNTDILDEEQMDLLIYFLESL